MNRIEFIRFGIEGLDELLGGGIVIPQNGNSTSLAIIGPDGAGKSILALHVAAQFAKDHGSTARVFFLSTDLKPEKAKAVWAAFEPLREISLEIVPANSITEIATALSRKPSKHVTLIDLATSSAGDDWGLVNRLSSLLNATNSAQNLLVVDAVEGLETLVGGRDGFGQLTSRRARIALLTRIAEGRTHLVLVVEETKIGRRLPEEFVADVVIRLRAIGVVGYLRRTLEIEKARGQGHHARGQHPITISGGDPKFVVYESLHSASRKLRRTDAAPRERVLEPFGISQLDRALESSPGFQSGCAASLIGDAGTHKSQLGLAFLSQAFTSAVEDLAKGRIQVSPRGSAVLMTSRRVEKPDLVDQLVDLLLRDASRRVVRHRVELRRYIDGRLVLAPMQMRDRAGPVLFKLSRNAVDEGLRIAKSGNAPASAVRVVVDDLTTFRDVYPDIESDPLYLPMLVEYLNRAGVSILLIATQDGKPTATPAGRFEGELLNLTSPTIRTWRVPFYGEERVAMAVDTLGDLETHSRLVMELLRTPTRFGVTVDSGFELYRGLETGRPEPVPLEIRYYPETEVFDRYMRTENAVFSALFPSVNGGNIFTTMPGGYEALRDFCSLGPETKIDHTLLMQIDEYWEPYGGRAFRRFGSQVGERSVRGERPTGSVDELFTDHSRAGGSAKVHSSSTLSLPLRQDRVPFMWDFGFLMLYQQAWMNCFDIRLPLLSRQRRLGHLTVGSVWSALRKPLKAPVAPSQTSKLDAIELRWSRSWRAFLESCNEVARRRMSVVSEAIAPFGLSNIGPQSLGCLILEIWASEVLITEKSGRAAHEFVRRIGHRESVDPFEIANWLQSYRKELYMSFLLLVDSMNFDDYANRDNPHEASPNRGQSLMAACRHWYKTATCSRGAFYHEEPYLPVGLPGSFSTRGDWYLAVASGSRSFGLSDRALDLLCSRRANLARLQLGIGLPVRPVCPEGQEKNLQTRLSFMNDRPAVQGDSVTKRRATLSYEDLCRLGATNENSRSDAFYWLWRSSFRGFDIQAQGLEKWLLRVLMMWSGLKNQYAGEWRSGFELYDQIRFEGRDTEVRKLESYKRFNELCEFAARDLRE